MKHKISMPPKKIRIKNEAAVDADAWEDSSDPESSATERRTEAMFTRILRAFADTVNTSMVCRVISSIDQKLSLPLDIQSKGIFDLMVRLVVWKKGYKTYRTRTVN